MRIQTKTKETAGADERTPSKSQYFSWINNTNEGATEEQTLINLRYFKWLKDTYNMQLDIYAWDAGNLDGASGTYERLEGEKLSKQYPNGYLPIAKAAAELGTRLGVWCGPDGFGNTEESGRARYELMVSLCRDYHFGLFKMDSVCGNVRKSKLDLFIAMMRECRKYSPDLILLNHRLDFGKAEPYATTYLLGGAETYVDVHITNETTAPHHRAFIFKRKNVPGLRRLTEDHGVCLSSCLDYFEDDLIIQAFGRCLILAPEIYANPWLLKDEEQARLARIYNLHRSYRDILVDGKTLPRSRYGENAVSRGSETNRFLVMGNCTWKTTKVSVKLGKSIGLMKRDEKVFVAAHHPYEHVYGLYNYGDTVEVNVLPFRAMLLQVCYESEKPKMLEGCDYLVMHETADGTPDEVKILRCGERIVQVDGTVKETKPMNIMPRAPIYLGTAIDCPIPENSREIIETAYFAMDADSLEARSLKRSGETAIPQVQAARDAFFSQRTYLLRGCENRFAFDGRSDTFFDGASKMCFGGMRIEEGCLRVDFGDVFKADGVMIEFFEPDEPIEDCIDRQNVEDFGEFSVDLGNWCSTEKVRAEVVAEECLDCIMPRVHNIKPIPGKRRRVYYDIASALRYFQLAEPMDRIFKIALLKDGKELELTAPFATNLMPAGKIVTPSAAQSVTVSVSDCLWRKDSYLSIGINGEHGIEGVTVVAEVEGKLYGCPDRACSYQSNAFECPVRWTDENYTYYLPVKPEFVNKPIKLHVIYTNGSSRTLPTEVCLCF